MLAVTQSSSVTSVSFTITTSSGSACAISPRSADDPLRIRFLLASPFPQVNPAWGAGADFVRRHLLDEHRERDVDYESDRSSARSSKWGIAWASHCSYRAGDQPRSTVSIE